MKKQLHKSLIIIALLFSAGIASAQTLAMNFVRNDCNGNMQNLFADLNSGKAVILEFFMISCAPCPAAGQKLELMKANLLTQYPGKIKSYSIGFSDSYSCATVKNWVTTNGFTSIPMDSGATQVAYYGGFGMPTIVILGGGTNHTILGSPDIGFTVSDTTTMANNIRNFLNTLGVKELSSPLSEIQLFPNPSKDILNIKITASQNTNLKIQLYNITGELISTLAEEKVSESVFSKVIRTEDLQAGNYILRITANDYSVNRKVTIIK